MGLRGQWGLHRQKQQLGRTFCSVLDWLNQPSDKERIIYWHALWNSFLCRKLKRKDAMPVHWSKVYIFVIECAQGVPFGHSFNLRGRGGHSKYSTDLIPQTAWTMRALALSVTSLRLPFRGRDLSSSNSSLTRDQHHNKSMWKTPQINVVEKKTTHRKKQLKFETFFSLWTRYNNVKWLGLNIYTWLHDADQSS